MVKWKITISAFLLCYGFGFTAIAQQNNEHVLPRYLREAGHPFVQNYAPSDYKAFDQNWGFAQDSLGILYVANGNGILTYDGVNWRLLELPNKGAVLSIASDYKNTIYVGAHNELGHLRPDSIGRLSYTSLLPYLNKEHHDFNLIRQVYATKSGIYFRGDGILMRWKDERFKVWESENGASLSAFPVGEAMYVWYEGKGLTLLKENGFTLLTKGERFAETRIRAVLPMGEQLLVATNDALFTYSGGVFSILKTDDPTFFDENSISEVIPLKNGTFAVGSNSKGILIIDSEGRTRTMVLDDKLLNSNQVFRLFQDDKGLLWAGLQSGIAKIEYPSPFSLYDKANMLSHAVLKVKRYQDRMYIGTTTGLYVMDFEGNTGGKAIADPQITGFTFDMLIHGNKLLVGSNGVYIIGDSVTKRIGDENVFCLVLSKREPKRVFVGHNGGLFSIYKNNGTWAREKTFDDITFTVHNIVEMPNGNLWLRTNANNIVRLAFDSTENANELGPYMLKTFDDKDGFPDDVGRPMLVENKLYFIAANGEGYLFDTLQQRFKIDSLLYPKLGIKDTAAEIDAIDDFGNIWVTTEHNKEKLDSYLVHKRRDGSYHSKNLNESRIVNLKRGKPYFEASDSVVWYNGKSAGIIRNNLKQPFLASKLPSPTLISEVTYGRDSTLFGGFGRANKVTLPFSQNLFRFQFASPGFFDEKNNRFQYHLEGYEDNWSLWSSENQKDYTNIPEGDYTFHVRARNVFGQIGKEGSYRFTILPPWYRTWWAYLMYSLLAGTILWSFGRWRSRRLYQKNLVLDGIVKQRTQEISEKNKLLKYQTKRLQELDTMKTRLFANISHEFRTPLTLIKGPIEKLESSGENKISTPNIKMIRRNSNRLLNLVNQLLDLSKLDSGKLRIDAAEGDVFKCIRAAASSFSSHAASRQIDYRIKIPSRLLWAEFDRDKLEKIVYNLLSNAFKFTEDEGKVTIEVEFRSGRLRLRVLDTGCGIAPAKLPHIFDRFFQVDDSYTREKAGSGIGLALTKELVELIGGTIYVESEMGEGTSFRVVVPLEEIKSNHIDESTEKIPLFVDRNEPTGLPEPKKIKSEVQVLIIEDNNDMRHFIREQLEQEYRIVEARNGREGHSMANKIGPELIVTDLMMPQMDGITLCKKLKTNLNTSHIPVIMLTAKAGIENKLEGLETGADDYLTKPFNAKELQIRVKNLITQRQQLRELYSKNISLDPKDITVTSIDEKFLNQILALLETAHTDSEFGVPEMQEHLAMSKTSLHNKTKALTGYPPGELLRNFRLRRAAQLLVQNSENVSQIAYDVGFNSLSYFTRCFKDLFHMSPTEFKEKNM